LAQDLTIDEFVQWLQTVLHRQEKITPDSDLRNDLSVDDFQFFQIVVLFDRLTLGKAPVLDEIYAEIRTVRDLYLHYLTVISMPLEL